MLRGFCFGAYRTNQAAAAFGGVSFAPESTTGGGIATTTDSVAALGAAARGLATAFRFTAILRFAGAFLVAAIFFFLVAAFFLGAALLEAAFLGAGFRFIAIFLFAAFVLRLGAALRPALRFFAFAIVFSVEVEILARRQACENSRSLL